MSCAAAPTTTAGAHLVGKIFFRKVQLFLQIELIKPRYLHNTYILVHVWLCTYLISQSSFTGFLTVNKDAKILHYITEFKIRNGQCMDK